MVFAADSEEEKLQNLMVMGTERSKPLHNFTLPCLKWGSQRHLRCMKINPAEGEVSGADRRSSASKLETRDFSKDSKKKMSASKLGVRNGGGDDGDDGIEAIGRKLLFDLKTTADYLKKTMLREEMIEGETKENEDTAEMPAPAPAVAATKPWNLRTRRGVSKASSSNGVGIKAALNVDEMKSNQNSPLSNEDDAKWPRPRSGHEKRERPKFSVSLSKKEIEEDFIEMTTSRPPRRPRKRPRTIQKQLDMLFPGLWLSEITADSYKVPEYQENAKR